MISGSLLLVPSEIPTLRTGMAKILCQKEQSLIHGSMDGLYELQASSSRTSANGLLHRQQNG